MPNPAEDIQNDSAVLNKNSKFHSQWLAIKKAYDKGGDKADGVEAEFAKFNNISKNMKGKESLSDKISSANISEWKDQKYIPLAFFQQQQKQFCIEAEKTKTFGELSGELPKEFRMIDPLIEEYCDDSVAYKKQPASVKQKLIEYGNKLQEQYLKNGLSHDEVEKRRERDGPNKMPEKQKKHWIYSLIHELTSIFSLLLWGGGALAFVAYGLTPDDSSNLWLAVVLWIVVFITGIFAFWQNSKSENIIDSFKSFSNAKATVVRGGETKEINGIDLVIGDVCSFKLGDKVPADIRIFEANSLAVNNSGLTGESDAVKMSSECGEKGYDNPLEAKNLSFFSTLCVLGSGKGVVIKTGKETFMGKIADLTQSASSEELGLEVELNRFIKVISVIAISLGLGFFFGSIGIGFPLISSFAFAIGIIVANVPEGLLSCLTVTLALTAHKLSKKNVMVKNMGCIETLGAITCICSDKTGTLTQNRMTVVHLWYDCEMKKLNMNQDDIQVDNNIMKLQMYSKDEPTFKYFQFGAVCGSSSNFKTETPDDYQELVQERNKWQSEHPLATNSEIMDKVEELKKKFQKQYQVYYNLKIDERLTDGDASEAGIIKFFEKVESIDNVRKRFPQHRVNNEDIKIPFNSAIKCAGFLRRIEDNNFKKDSNFLLAFKGAPDYLIKKCTHYMLNGQEHPIDEFFNNRFREANQAFALKGERVLAMAYYKFNKNEYPEDFEFKNDIGGEGENKIPNYPTDKLCFLGLVGMEDPPREGVREAIAICKKAGIKVIMVTGDQTLTAASIAYQIGIIEDLDDTPEVIQAREGLRTLEDAEKKSNTIIIDGGRLNKCLKADESLSEDNPHKGEFLRHWIMKRDCVFARTSPDQKLIIVNACQNLSHVVAVTGDGVNDSPAIKKADIGIAMGKVGTDVAKDAADILLLDDNFANILKGIKQGRVIFDTLKKIIAYNLSTNVAELIPVIAYFIFAFPIPLTTILILTIDVGSDIYPNIAFAYEGAESNIMDRLPRNSKTERLCSMKLFSWAYLFMGMVLMSAPMLAYFVCLNDYGITPNGSMGLTTDYGVVPLESDKYNPYDDKFKGNSNAFIYENMERLGIEVDTYEFVDSNGDDLDRQLDFIANKDNLIDFRVFFYTYESDKWGTCYYHDKSYKGDGQACWSLEAVRYAQGSYLVNIVLTQISNGLAYRTITASIFTHVLKNHDLNFAYLVENLVMCILIYVPGLNYGFALRPLRIQHWVPCLGTFITLFFYSEFTKYLIRNYNNPDGTKGFFNKFYKY